MNLKQKIIAILIVVTLLLLWRDNKNNEHLTNSLNEDLYNREYTELRCDSNSEMYNGMCYRKCKPEYENQGSLCVKQCSGGLQSTETHCLKNQPEFIGKEYNSLEECLSENNNGCFKEGLKFYALCPKGRKQVGNFCEDTCLGNMQDDGFGCLRTSYIKGVGNTQVGEVCPKGTDRIGDRCYVQCKDGYTKNGVFCVKNKILNK